METKPIYKSKTIIGSVVALGAIFLSTFFNLEIGIGDKNQLTESIVNILGSVGAIVAIYGRVVADKKIK